MKDLGKISGKIYTLILQLHTETLKFYANLKSEKVEAKQ